MKEITDASQALIGFERSFIFINGKYYITPSSNEKDNVQISEGQCVAIANVLLQYNDNINAIQQSHLLLANECDKLRLKNNRLLKVIKAMKKLTKSLLEDI